MVINSNIIFFIIALLVQVLISFTKFRKFGILFVIISCIVFLILRDEMIYNLALTQFIIYFVLLVVFEIINHYMDKKKTREIDILKIKDL